MKFHNLKLFSVLSAETKRKVADFMLKHTASMSEREIASILKISHMSVNRTMQLLLELNFVESATVGNAHMWKVNRKSYTYEIVSQAGTNRLVIRCPLEDLRLTILKHLPKKLVKRVVLFGSIAKGLEKSNSDIDVFILVGNAAIKENIELYIEKLTGICLDRYGNRLASYILTEQELKKKKKLEIISEIDKGIEIFPKIEY